MKFLVIAALVSSLLSCNNPSATVAGASDSTATAKNDSLDALFSNYWEDRMKLYPVEATLSGDNRYNDRLTLLFTDSFRDTLRHFYTDYLNRIGGYQREQLGANDRISYDIFKREMQMQLEELQFPGNEIPFNQFWAFPLDLGQLGSGEASQPFKTVADYRNWSQRAACFGAWADSAIVYFRKGMASGVVLPRALVLKMIPQMKDLGAPDTAKNVFYGPLRKFPSGFSAAEKDSLSGQLTAVLKQQVLPAYGRLAAFLQTEYLPKARNTTGIKDIPGGADRYNYLIRYWTTTDKTAEEIYATGLSEVK
ncbi:MAG TPA: DUF885 family protein, partial [Flavisolibacter sp.]|nr:DUF885 family protein [Flavisolibacter sp.]